MRVASTQFHSSMNTALQQASVRLQDIMQKMATGNRLLRPSEDPVTHVRLSRLSREEAALTQYRDNIGALQARSRQNETLLAGMVNDMQDARDLLVWAADGGNTPADIQAMAGSLGALAESLLFTANTQDQEGRYLFSGTLTSTPAISYDPAAPLGSRYSFTGNDEKQLVVIGNGVTRAANVSIGEMAALLNQLEDTGAQLQAGDASTAGTALGQLDGALNSVAGKIAALGSSQNILDTADTNHANVSLSNKQALLDLGQLDYGDAAVKLNGYSSALQATQKAYAQISRLSLFEAL